MEHLLDNPVWNALNTGNRSLANGTGQAKYFSSDVSPFVGIEAITANNFHLLYDCIPFKGSFGFVSTAKIEFPAPWKVVSRVDVLQMILNKPLSGNVEDPLITPLIDAHVPEMMALAKLTNPGPFAARTINFGHYRGIFSDGCLTAMAGQRMYPAPYAEISAVCTHPDFLGRGFAKKLLLNQVQRLQANAEIPFLHVLAHNNRAIHVYKAIGFEIRREINIYIIEN